MARIPLKSPTTKPLLHTRSGPADKDGARSAPPSVTSQAQGFMVVSLREPLSHFRHSGQLSGFRGRYSPTVWFARQPEQWSLMSLTFVSDRESKQGRNFNFLVEPEFLRVRH